MVHNLVIQWVKSHDPLSSFEKIKRAYQNLAQQVQDDESTIKLLNWAFVMAKQALGIYSWDEVIQWSDIEIKRIGWTKEQAQDYLLKNYGKRSRALLSDEAILDYLQRLRRID
jgi:hypothetical protein